MRSDFTEVPLINISGLYSADIADRKRVADEISYAARNVGFFYASGHQVEASAIEGVKEAAKEFFATPMDYKMNYYIGKSKCHRGYVPEGEEVFDDAPPDHKEAIDLGMELPLDHPAVKRGLPMHGPNQWPADLPGFREKVETYYTQVVALSKALIRGFALALGETEEEFGKHFDEQISLLRLIRYPFNADAGKKKRGIGEHTDYECFTILFSDTPGLEVVNRKHEWVPVPPIPGAFVVNISDMLETLTNGAFVATAHRVLSVPQERYSFPLFTSCNYDTRLAPLPQFVNGEMSQTARQAGSHMWASLMQTYKYLIDQVRSGALELPEGSQPKGEFETKKATA